MFGNELKKPKKPLLSQGFTAGLFLLFLAFPAHADVFEETEESYYTRQMQSCFFKKERTSIWDLFAATRPVYLDNCCARSVYAMQAADAEWIAAEENCPEGMVKTSVNCETTKHWCASAASTPPPSDDGGNVE